MDLIYTDSNRVDQGILNSYNFDMAIGDSENNFECTIDRSDHCCKEGYFLYVENEEYGGIIDSIQVNTAAEEIKYKGRTWHGVLEGKVILPDEGQAYAVFEGEANSVLKNIIKRLDLSSLFDVSTVNSGITIFPFQMERYVKGYTGIRQMLRANDAKLKLRWHKGKVLLSAEPRYDYSQDDEFNTMQVDFSLNKNFTPINHLVCLGQGDLEDRAVIHIFTDENGGIQPYARTEQPLQDSDYILTQENKAVFGSKEKADVLDYPNADITTNYILLSSKPNDWDANCEAYFYRQETVTDEEYKYDYKAVERLSVDVYYLQTYTPVDWDVAYSNYFVRESDDSYKSVSSTTNYIVQSQQPSDWTLNYGEYFLFDGASYKSVEGVEAEIYTAQNKKPSDWDKKYSEYYVFYSDGVKSEYNSVSGVSRDSYKVQTAQPTDWKSNYSSYYKKKKTGGYKAVEAQGAPTFQANKYYKKNSKGKYELLTTKPSDWDSNYKSYYYKKNSRYYEVEGKNAPTWKAKTYYTKYTVYDPPKWEKGKYYTKSKVINAPVWIANYYYTKYDNVAPVWQVGTYYTKVKETPAPTFVTDTYYYAVFDRYASLVRDAISKLEELWQADELSIDLEETEQTYDIDDIVGAVEQVTGIETVQTVTKKIIKIINSDDITIKYEVS